jgi:hypothetical protein
VHRGFVRAPSDALTTFDVSAAGTGIYQGTEAYAINAAGTITGFYIDANGVSHGFVRVAFGSITTFDTPGAGTGTYQ